MVEGQIFTYIGGWQNDAVIGMVWGYDENGGSPIKLVSAGRDINQNFTIPDGVRKIKGWVGNSYLSIAKLYLTTNYKLQISKNT